MMGLSTTKNERLFNLDNVLHIQYVDENDFVVTV